MVLGSTKSNSLGSLVAARGLEAAEHVFREHFSRRVSSSTMASDLLSSVQRSLLSLLLTCIL